MARRGKANKRWSGIFMEKLPPNPTKEEYEKRFNAFIKRYNIKGGTRELQLEKVIFYLSHELKLDIFAVECEHEKIVKEYADYIFWWKVLETKKIQKTSIEKAISFLWKDWFNQEEKLKQAEKQNKNIISTIEKNIHIACGDILDAINNKENNSTVDLSKRFFRIQKSNELVIRQRNWENQQKEMQQVTSENLLPVDINFICSMYPTYKNLYDLEKQSLIYFHNAEL
ncbi:MAG: hypothetical protein PHX18_04290 [Candidatus Gastranaerophilales bacterium]|nr:hypothetical protein [Candidatus Gastranaerophilales bacterium]